MWRLSAIILISVIINFASSLDCYMCMASLTSDCRDANPKSKVIQHCIAAENITNVDTFCVTAIAGDSPAMGRNFLRGCGYIYTGQDICKYIIDNGIAEECISCNKDLCNLDVLPRRVENNEIF